MSLEWLITNLLSAWLLLPLNLITLMVIGLALARKRRRLGLTITWLSLAALTILSTGAAGNFLASTLESDLVAISPLQAQKFKPGAIVILGGGMNRGSPEYGGETVSQPALGRLRYGARLAREYRLPVLVTGGKPDREDSSEAELMAKTLEQDFGVEVRWREHDSINTIENARYSARILSEANIKKVILVTDAWHMPRSVERFRNAGLEVLPAPTNYLSQPRLTPVDFLPSAEGLRKSNIALHEWIGILVSRARGV